MKKWIWQIIGVILIVGVIGVVGYVGVKKVLGSFILPDVSAVQQQIDELVDDLERARNDLSGLRDSLETVTGGLSSLRAELDGSAASAARLEERINESIRRERELEGFLGGAEDALGIVAQGIGRNEAALLRLREYIDSYEEDGGD